MNIISYQNRVDEWIKSYGVRYFDEKTNMILLVEEVGELARLIAREYGEQSFKSTTNRGADMKMKIADEICDIIFVLSCLSNQMDIDLTDAIQLNFSKKTNRDSDRHESNPKLNQ